ncbi:MAG: hypothetical protein GY801_16755, partial [bacterium]|nr:hypothetical protein [bacterium]
DIGVSLDKTDKSEQMTRYRSSLDNLILTDYLEFRLYRQGKFVNSVTLKVPRLAWDFYIGGYQPAQKWLKDRRGRTLNFDDILHYQKIIVAIVETDRIMKEIDKLDFME